MTDREKLLKIKEILGCDTDLAIETISDSTCSKLISGFRDTLSMKIEDELTATQAYKLHKFVRRYLVGLGYCLNGELSLDKRTYVYDKGNARVIIAHDRIIFQVWDENYQAEPSWVRTWMDTSDEIPGIFIYECERTIK